MKRTAFCTILFLLLFFTLSCERQKAMESKPKIRANAPPVITSVDMTPKTPNKDMDLDLVIRSQDPDGDPVSYQYQWFKNDEEILSADKNVLPKGNFKKGDLIQVKVTPSDGKAEGKPFLSEQARVLNSPPVIQEVRVEPKIAYVTDQLRVQVKSSDIDGDSIYYSYQWESNGALLPDEKTEVLEKGRFKKGDVMTVAVTPDDRESKGSAKKSEPITIVNSPPMIVSSPPTSVQGNEYIYQVNAIDPDNDPITFALKSAPKGMEIDKD
jgi:hypothetical protein